jgi:hypothetical protein
MIFFKAGIFMIPKHKIFHTVLFIAAINVLLCCPSAHALVEHALQKSCCVSSHVELKKQYCQTRCKQDKCHSLIVHSVHDLFSATVAIRHSILTAHPLATIPSPLQASMRLNL